MSNQVLLWSILILPWFTLVFMDRNERKRLIPAALFSIVTSILVVEIAEAFNLWVIKETAKPLRTASYLFGLNPIITMWLLRFTQGRFRTYFTIDVILNFGFVYLFLEWFLGGRGIYQRIFVTELETVLISSLHGAVIYGFYIWHSEVLARSERTNYSTNLQPAVAKPLPQKQDNQNDNE